MMTKEFYANNEEMYDHYKLRRKTRGEKTKLYLGVELEVSAHGNRLESGEKVKELLGDNIIIKPEHITNGFEIVTCPATLKYHTTKLWNGFFEAATPYVYAGSDCGLHIHFSRDAVDDVVLSKCIVFYHEPNNSKFLTEIAGRLVDTSAKWCRTLKKTYDINDPTVAITETLAARGAIGVSSRLKGSTVEVRIFASTLKREKLLQQLEFVVAVTDFCNNPMLGEKELSHGTFIKWFVAKERKYLYPNLHAYLVYRKYIHEVIGHPTDIQVLMNAPQANAMNSNPLF